MGDLMRPIPDDYIEVLMNSFLTIAKLSGWNIKVKRFNNLSLMTNLYEPSYEYDGIKNHRCFQIVIELTKNNFTNCKANMWDTEMNKEVLDLYCETKKDFNQLLNEFIKVI